MLNEIKEWYNYKSPHRGNANIIQNWIYKILWRFNFINSPSCGNYNEFKNRNKKEECYSKNIKSNIEKYIKGDIMNIKKMLEAQKQLDNAMFEKSGITEYPAEMIETAYRVELGEALQEWKQFKYWKANKGEVDREKLLEEIADCLHFALSLENYNNDQIEEYLRKEIDDSFIMDVKENAYQCDVYEIIELCFKIKEYDDLYNWGLESTIALGLKLGFTLQELEQAYWHKNIINWKRIRDNY